jgi:MoaA/NifB/PqqE/SkfB family radical SAM enzyme
MGSVTVTTAANIPTPLPVSSHQVQGASEMTYMDSLPRTMVYGESCLVNKVPVSNPRTIFDPKSLGFRLTYRCNSKCEHCYCYTDKDSSDATDLRFEDIEPLISQAKSIGMTGVGLSGGEPFLLMDSIYSIFERAKKTGLNVNFATNAFWAKHFNKAVNVLTRLKTLGFKPPGDSIAVSAGQFHLPFISRDCSANLIKAYRAVFGVPLPRLDFEYVSGNKEVLSEYVSYLTDQGISDKDYKLVERTVFQTTGNSRIVSDEIIKKRPASVFQGLCPWVKDLIVDPDGDVYPCCGFNRYNKGIVLGNIHDQSLESIRNSAQTNPVMIMLKFHSFAYLHSLVRLEFNLPEDADGLCDICEDIFSNSQHVKYLIDRHSHLYAF